MKTRSYFFALLLLGAGFQFCNAEIVATPTHLFRVGPQFVEWGKESDALIDCYRKELKPPEDTKIVPLFICAHLGLGEPVGEYGARVIELAFVYSETKLENGTQERKIVVLHRSPYQNRRWTWSEVAAIVEGEDDVMAYILLQQSGDLHKQLSAFVMNIIHVGERDHVISMIVFDKGVSKVFGKELDGKALLALLPQPKAPAVGKE